MKSLNIAAPFIFLQWLDERPCRARRFQAAPMLPQQEFGLLARGTGIIGMAPETQFDELEAEIEILRARLDTFRQASALSRAAIWGGGAILVFVLTVAGAYRTPPVVFGSIAAVLGGIVWFGANKASREDTEERLAAAEAEKTRLFEKVAARNGWWDLTPTVH